MGSKSKSKQTTGPTAEGREAARITNALNQAVIDAVQPEMLEALGFDNIAQIREGAVTSAAQQGDIARQRIQQRARQFGGTGSGFEQSALSQVDLSQLANVGQTTQAVRGQQRGQASNLFSALQGNPVIGQTGGTSKQSSLSVLG